MRESDSVRVWGSSVEASVKMSELVPVPEVLFSTWTLSPRDRLRQWKVVLTMCRAANTPSTMAQQKAATTPKLMKTMAATS